MQSVNNRLAIAYTLAYIHVCSCMSHEFLLKKKSGNTQQKRVAH